MLSVAASNSASSAPATSHSVALRRRARSPLSGGILSTSGCSPIATGVAVFLVVVFLTLLVDLVASLRLPILSLLATTHAPRGAGGVSGEHHRTILSMV